MPPYDITLPDGSKHTVEGLTKRDAYNKLMIQQGKSILPGHQGEPARPHETGMKLGGVTDIINGIAQGMLDPFEGLAQLGERYSGKKIPLEWVAQLAEWYTGEKLPPDWVRQKAREFRKNAQSTIGGNIGEAVGNVGMMIAPGMGAAKGLQMAARIGRPGARVPAGIQWASNALQGGLGGYLQPVQGAKSQEEFDRIKQSQAAAGLIAGSTLPSLSQLAARVMPTRVFMHHHPWAAAIPAIIGATGRGARRLPAAGLGGAAAEEFAERVGSGEAKAEGAPRRPLQLTVHPDSPDPEEPDNGR